jgi:prepilin-type N-terminal cleavage/methylation domain-containing protein
MPINRNPLTARVLKQSPEAMILAYRASKPLDIPNTSPGNQGARVRPDARPQPDADRAAATVVAARAFTMIELLIVIAVIAILATILFLGARGVIGGSKEKATRITLGALQSMLAELDAKTKLGKSPQAWYWYDNGRIARGPDAATTIDFWRIPHRIPAGNTDALDAPGLVAGGSAEGDANRNASHQVLNTQIAMSMLLGLPSNRQALEKISADRYFIPERVEANTQLFTPGADGAPMTGDDGSSSSDAKYYLGTKVLHKGKKYFWNSNSTTLGNSVPPAASWVDDVTPQVPVLLDAWDNPIIFVPGTGLRVRMLNGESKYGDRQSSGAWNNIPTNVKTFIAISPGGAVDYSGAVPVVTKPGRPFFVSAGPDGDFAKGDDNIYSFEQ